MKLRRLLALGAMILGVGFLGAFPQTAQAAIACQQVVTHAGTKFYPDDYWTQYCGTATLANGQQMNGSISNLQGQARSEAARSANRNFNGLNGVAFYIFGTPAEYQQWTTEQGRTYVAPGMNDFGVLVLKSGTNIPEYSAIFMKNLANVVNTNVPYRTGQQAGRAVDYLQGFIKNGGIQPPTLFRVSDTTGGVWAPIYQTNLNTDWTNLNALAPCKVGSVNGLFSTRQDSAGVYICNGTNGTGTALIAAYASLADNKARLKAAWPAIYNTDAGIFADQISKRYGMGTDTVSAPKSGDIYFAANFACSQWFAGSVTNRGRLPAAGDTDQMPVGCTLPTMTTKCRKLFTGPGQFPSGNIFKCETTPALAEEVLTKLTHIGGATSYTPIKNEFDRVRANIYIFDTVVGYQNAFNAAGQFVPAGVGATVASTYPNPNAQGIWHTIIFRDQYGDPPMSAEAAYTATHELGHVLDDTRIPQVSSTMPTPYDRSMQNDWLNLDYVNFAAGAAGQRNPCGSVAANGYKGPLVGVTDPTTFATNPPNGLPFCNGTVVRAVYAGQRTSTILRTVYPGAAEPPRRQAAGHIGPNSPNGYNTLLGWREWHAEAFAIRAKAHVVTVPVIEDWSLIVGNGYFTCTAGPPAAPLALSWAYAEYTTGTVPAAGSEPCQGALPAGWVDIH